MGTLQWQQTTRKRGQLRHGFLGSRLHLKVGVLDRGLALRVSVPHSRLHLKVGVLDRGLALRVSVPHSRLHLKVGVLDRAWR